VRRGETVLYDCVNCRNFQELIILSKFVGTKGQVIATSNKDICMNNALDLYKIFNIRFGPRNHLQYV